MLDFQQPILSVFIARSVARVNYLTLLYADVQDWISDGRKGSDSWYVPEFKLQLGGGWALCVELNRQTDKSDCSFVRCVRSLVLVAS